jgi:hypothetical protein
VFDDPTCSTSASRIKSPTTATSGPRTNFSKPCCSGRLKGLWSNGTFDMAGIAVNSAPTDPKNITRKRYCQGESLKVSSGKVRK